MKNECPAQCTERLTRLEEKFAASLVSLKLQAQEYERRLSSLNHEAQQLKDMQAKYTPRETWETNHKTLENDIKKLFESKNILEGKATQSSVYIGWGLAIIAILVSFYKSFR
jgi:DNA repair exonuclease SbcCD ATPase subunit